MKNHFIKVVCQFAIGWEMGKNSEQITGIPIEKRARYIEKMFSDLKRITEILTDSFTLIGGNESTQYPFRLEVIRPSECPSVIILQNIRTISHSAALPEETILEHCDSISCTMSVEGARARVEKWIVSFMEASILSEKVIFRFGNHFCISHAGFDVRIDITNLQKSETKQSVLGVEVSLSEVAKKILLEEQGYIIPK